MIDVADRVPQERSYLALAAPRVLQRRTTPRIDIASRILTDGLSSRLNKALVYDRQLCTAVAIVPDHRRDRQLVRDHRHRAPRRVARPRSSRSSPIEIASLAKTGPTQAELDRARKTKQEFEFVSGLERIGGFGGKADLLNQYNIYLGDPGTFDADLARYRTLTVGDVRGAVARWLDTRNRVLIRFHPEKSGRPAETTLDRSQAAGHRRGPPVQGAVRPDDEARERARRVRRRARGPAEGGRDARHARRRDRGSRRQAGDRAD